MSVSCDSHVAFQSQEICRMVALQIRSVQSFPEAANRNSGVKATMCRDCKRNRTGDAQAEKLQLDPNLHLLTYCRHLASFTRPWTFLTQKVPHTETLRTSYKHKRQLWFGTTPANYEFLSRGSKFILYLVTILKVKEWAVFVRDFEIDGVFGGGFFAEKPFVKDFLMNLSCLLNQN